MPYSGHDMGVVAYWNMIDADGSGSLDREEFGDLASQEDVYKFRQAQNNIAYTFIEGVRRRKGLPTDTKIVVAAEKQRTLTRNK